MGSRINRLWDYDMDYEASNPFGKRRKDSPQKFQKIRRKKKK